METTSRRWIAGTGVLAILFIVLWFTFSDVEKPIDPPQQSVENPKIEAISLESSSASQVVQFESIPDSYAQCQLFKIDFAKKKRDWEESFQERNGLKKAIA